MMILVSFSMRCWCVLIIIATLFSGTHGDCDIPPRLQYGELTPEFAGKNFTTGDVVQYNCRPGYLRIPNTNNSIICLSNSSWSTPDVFCQLRSCGNPGDLPNGELHAEDFFFGSRVNYTCNLGYNMISKFNYRICQADGTWSNGIPICEVQICTSPGSIINGTFSPQKDEYSFQDSVKYECIKGLVLVGESSQFCTEFGNWSHALPSCKDVKCANPSVSYSTRLSGFNGPYTLNSAITFACVEGFDLFGPSTITCNIDSQWEPSLPECLGRCGVPPSLHYAQLKPEFGSQITFSSGIKVQYTCQLGYNPVSGKDATIICHNSIWSTPDVFCTPQICQPPENIVNGNFIPQKDQYKYNEMVTYRCFNNTTIVGDSSRFCTDTGKWSSVVPSCDDGNDAGVIFGNLVLLLTMIVVTQTFRQFF
ncbi:C4b-binding protein alpha chain isoform X2 [Xenopus laevis]|uniref:C4b-binding protein alpha chain isoform X2 n=1 Tax=Xenopus laevis TaxID=8355 RepID=A0A8J0UEZ1_XENLA|nr:C4b-binding protein alpha chain isoform X2 [Xenopus laevis]